MFRVGIFIAKKDGERLVKWLSERYSTHEEAREATDKKNRDLGIYDYGRVPPGRKFAMYCCV